VDILNSNFEWNRVGIAIDAGDSILIQGAENAFLQHLY